MPTCKKCGTSHFNFQPCSVGAANAARAAEEDKIARHNLMPEITPPDEWHPWRQEPMETVRLHGGLQVVKSGLKQRDGWREV